MAQRQKAHALTAETLAKVKERARACFMCRYILEALGPEFELRDWPPGAETADFPASAQAAHVRTDVLSAGAADRSVPEMAKRLGDGHLAVLL
jgi:hypothetical protein